jgi:hypothetical protein
MVINQIVECPWEKNPPHSHGPTSLSSSSTNEAIDGDLRACEQMELNLKATWLKWHHMIYLTWKCVKCGRWRGKTHINYIYIVNNWTKRPKLQNMPLRHYKGNWGQCKPHNMIWNCPTLFFVWTIKHTAKKDWSFKRWSAHKQKKIVETKIREIKAKKGTP